MIFLRFSLSSNPKYYFSRRFISKSCNLFCYKPDISEKVKQNASITTRKTDGEEDKQARLDDVLNRRFFYVQSCEIYGGSSGLYDLGPMGCALKNNILNEWRKFFILEEQMLEVSSCILTPKPVLVASGHAERFADLIVKDTETGEGFRLDHLIKGYLEREISTTNAADLRVEYQSMLSKLDDMDKREMADLFRKLKIKSPTMGNELSDPSEYNLMFDVSLGATGSTKGYLRPETAQGIFVNFKRLLEFNQGKLPFAAAQIGEAFRNEISPKSGLIRAREFIMAEIEHFVDPDNKNHPKFEEVKDMELPLFSATRQLNEKQALNINVGEAVEKSLIANQTVAYYLARIYSFLVKIGVDPNMIRFRQHFETEMAHYAMDCWDAECKTSHGWLECVGCADRSCYDLNVHSQATNVKLSFDRQLENPIVKEVLEIKPHRSMIMKKFKKYGKEIITALENNAADEMLKHFETSSEFELPVLNKTFKITKEMVEVKQVKKHVTVEEVIPSVVEPSFGIGRIMYAVLEHNFRIRDDVKRTYFTFPAITAPVKCSILPLMSRPELVAFTEQIMKNLKKMDVSHKLDFNGSIGRRYARTDSIGIPFGITVDFDTLQEPHTVTLRDRDSMNQVRIPVNKVGEIIRDLCNEVITWQDVLAIYPAQAKTEK